MRRNREICIIMVVTAAAALAASVPMLMCEPIPYGVGKTPNAGAEPDPLGRGTLFAAASTIMGLAVFGSMLSMRIWRRPKLRDWPHRAKFLVFMGIIILIIVQATFMSLLVEGHSNGCTRWWITVTAICLVAIVALAAVAKSLPKGKDDPHETDTK